MVPLRHRGPAIAPGDDAGIGAITRSRWQTALPYGFVFDTRTTRSERPNLSELVAEGDLTGSGRWELAADGPFTTVRYAWNVRPSMSWMDFLAPIARPAFAWNHAVIMRAGGEGLANRLGAKLVKNQSFTEESASPVGALTAIGGLIALAILTVSSVRRIVDRG